MPTPDTPWFVFAFDHRDSFRRIIGSTAPDDVVAAKTTLYAGLHAAQAEHRQPGMAALIDEEYGRGLIERAGRDDVAVIIPIERSGQRTLTFEYGDAAYEHIEQIDPTAVKVLVRWDPDDASGTDARQGALLAELDEWMRAAGRTLIVEFLAPEQPDSSRRADALCRCIEQIRAAGCTPPLWKVEGLDTTEHARRVGEAVSAGPRRGRAVVLGRGVDMDTAARWLRCAAPVPAFAGFAIGKTLWQEPLQRWLRGEIGRDDAVATIAGRYLDLIEVWQGAASGTRRGVD